MDSTWRNKFFSLFTAVGLAVMLSACGGSGGGGTTTTTTGGGAGASGGTGSALAVAETVSVVSSGTDSLTTASVDGVPALTADFRASAVSALAASSDYKSDPQNIYVEERSASVFSEVNNILCMIGQTKYDEMVNKGDYKAQIDEKKCKNQDSASGNSSGGGSNGGGSSGASNAPTYKTWIVNSYRADSTSDHIVSIWVHESDGPASGFGQVIYVRSVITASATDKPPYGLFTMNFIGYPQDKTTNVVDTTKPIMKGFLSASEDTNGKISLNWGMKDSGNFAGMSIEELAILYKNSDGTGSGTVKFSEDGGSFQGATSSTKKFDITFDSSEFLRTELDTTTDSPVSGGATCLNRTSFESTAWRYGLYYDETPPTGKTAGARVNVGLTGFPIKYNDRTDDYSGWVGMWGLWLPGDPTVADGATVTRQYFDGTADEDYTYNVIRGKLQKHTASTISLVNLKKIPLQIWDNTNNVNVEVHYDGTNFVKDKYFDNSKGVWKDVSYITTPASGNLSLASLNWTQLWFWSQALSGSVQIDITGCTGSGPFNCSSGTLPLNANVDSTSEVNLGDDVDSAIAGTQTSVTFYCLTGCPDPTTAYATLADSSNSNDNPYFTNLNYQALATGSATYRSYTFSSASGTNSLMLMSSGTATSFPTTYTSGGPYDWGINSGPLFTATDKASLDCTGNTGNTCSWQARGLTTYYAWRTSPNNWDQKAILTRKSDSAVAKFSEPLRVSYTHTNDASTTLDDSYAGKPVSLQYGGFGDLWGIPGDCVNESGTEVSCDTAGFIRYIPLYSIPDGKTVSGTDADGNTDTFYVKGLEKEQRMKVKSGCTITRDSAQPYTLPDPTALFTNPTTLIGTEPTITASPKVVGGVVQ